MKTLKEIFEEYQIYNDKGEPIPLLETELGKELFKEVEQSRQADVSGSLPDELLLAAIKYGYDYHSTTSFPNEAFEVNMLGNALQWIENQKQ